VAISFDKAECEPMDKQREALSLWEGLKSLNCFP
jgi:hypothetical protein